MGVPMITLNDGNRIPQLGFGTYKVAAAETADTVRTALDIGYRHIDTGKTLEEFKADGRARSIGVSNFAVHHLQELARETDTVPAVNQIEVHPYFTNDDLRAYGVEHDIVTEAWSPIARGKVLGDPVVTRISRATGAYPAQVVLRWHIERGDIVFPKSVHPQRMKENFEIFDFEINDEEIEALTALDRGEAGRMGPNPDVFDYIPD